MYPSHVAVKDRVIFADKKPASYLTTPESASRAK
jgi:hypothetical protein